MIVLRSRHPVKRSLALGYSTRDVGRLGLVILALATLLIVAVMLPYWRALGLPLTAALSGAVRPQTLLTRGRSQSYSY